MIGAIILIVAATLALPWLTSFSAVVLTQATAHGAAVMLAPAIASVTLGIFGRRGFTKRIGRNETFNHLGNACAACAAGLGAYYWGPVVVFYLLAGMGVASILSVLAIPADAIDHDLARGLDDKGAAAARDDHQPSGWTVLMTCRPLLVFSACAVLFHFANAAMLPLVGQKLALQNANLGTSLMSACIVAAQIVMVPMALAVGAFADRVGRKPLLLAGFLILPIRGVLYTLSDDPYWLVGVQLLDGVGAGLYGALFPIIVADLMRGTGRFNVAQGAVATAQGIGAALSTSVAGLIVVTAGYSAAFLTLAGVGMAGLLLCLVGLREPGRAPPPEARSSR
jgi:predicted MFS family arabinose efflux permease